MLTLQHSLIIIITITFGFNSSAQLNDSIAISTNGSWIIEYNEANFNSYGGMTVYTNYTYYRSGGDTLINGESYTKLLKTIVYKNSNGTYSLNHYSQLDDYHLAYRNDMNKRAFKVPDGSSTEELWYDFNYEIGDTIWSPNTLAGMPYLIHNSTDSVDYCGINYPRRHFDGNYNFLQEDYYDPGQSIQGVGSTDNFFYNYPGYKHDNLVYFCEESIPFDLIAGIEEKKITDIVKLFPNPTKNIFHITIDSGILPERVTIQNLAGEVVFHDESGSSSFSVENFSSGVYLVFIEFEGEQKKLRLIKE